MVLQNGIVGAFFSDNRKDLSDEISTAFSRQGLVVRRDNFIVVAGKASATCRRGSPQLDPGNCYVISGSPVFHDGEKYVRPGDSTLSGIFEGVEFWAIIVCIQNGDTYK